MSEYYESCACRDCYDIVETADPNKPELCVHCIAGRCARKGDKPCKRMDADRWDI